MEINRKLLNIFCHTQFDSKFKYNKIEYNK